MAAVRCNLFTDVDAFVGSTLLGVVENQTVVLETTTLRCLCRAKEFVTSSWGCMLRKFSFLFKLKLISSIGVFFLFSSQGTKLLFCFLYKADIEKKIKLNSISFFCFRDETLHRRQDKFELFFFLVLYIKYFFCVFYIKPYIEEQKSFRSKFFLCFIYKALYSKQEISIISASVFPLYMHHDAEIPCY